MSEEQEYILENIQKQFSAGFYNSAFIEELMLEIIAEEEIQAEVSAEWVHEQVRLANRKQRQLSKIWAKPTDPQRLFAAFEELISQQIIALHHVGFSNADGEEAVLQIERELRKEGLQSKGYCFYHAKDLEDAIFTDYGHLSIAFQIINNEDDQATLALGQLLCETLSFIALLIGAKREKASIAPNDFCRFLLVGPIWLWHFVFKKLNVRY